MPMVAVALIGAISSIAPWILGWFALGGNAKDVSKNVQDGFGGLIQKPISAAMNAWIEVALVAAGLGLTVWLVESKLAHRMGQEVGAPPVESIHVASPPTFGTAGGYGFRAGPLNVGGSVQAAGGAPSYEGGSRGVGSGGSPMMAAATSAAASRTSAKAAAKRAAAAPSSGFHA